MLPQKIQQIFIAKKHSGTQKKWRERFFLLILRRPWPIKKYRLFINNNLNPRKRDSSPIFTLTKSHSGNSERFLTPSL